jgi:hypothetical protein
MAISGAVGFTYFLVTLLQCRPISSFWNLHPEDCSDSKLLGDAAYVSHSVNAMGSWTLGILPVFIVRNLDLTKRQKIEVAGLLSLAGLSVVHPVFGRVTDIL